MPATRPTIHLITSTLGVLVTCWMTGCAGTIGGNSDSGAMEAIDGNQEEDSGAEDNNTSSDGDDDEGGDDSLNDAMADYDSDCVPICTDKECGPDICGNECPPGCSGYATCSQDGHCICPNTSCGDACCAPGDICSESDQCVACVNDGTRKHFGMFFSCAGSDCEGIEPLVAGTAELNRLTVVQDYKNPQEAAASIASIVSAHQKGNIVHLNLMPVDNIWDSQVSTQIHAFGANLAQELLQTTVPGILITIGPEMNGTWTAYGCTQGQPDQIANSDAFLLLHNNTVEALRAEMQAAGVARSRLRIVWGPNVSPGPAGGPCSYTVYWPGWTYVDFIGYSHYSFAGTYRSGPQIVQTASTILQDIGENPADPANYGKVMILQTGMEYGQAGHDRGAWIGELFDTVINNRLLSGMILFQSPDYGPNNRPEPKLRWVDYGTLAPLEGFSILQTEITGRTRFSQRVGFLFCN